MNPVVKTRDMIIDKLKTPDNISKQSFREKMNDPQNMSSAPMSMPEFAKQMRTWMKES